MGSFKGLLVSVILAGLFFISLIMFGIQFSSDQGVVSPILQEKSLNDSFNSINDSLYDLQEKTDSNWNATHKENPEESDQSLKLFTIWSTIKSSGKIVKAVSTSMFSILASIGIPPIVLGVLLAIIVLTLIFLGWKTIRSGE